MQMTGAEMQSDVALSVLGHSIQTAITPVFLLSGVAAFLGVLNSRLLRVIDRTRSLEEHEQIDEQDAAELAVLLHRRHWINRAITLCTLSAILISLLIVIMFLGAVVHVDVGRVVVTLFIAALIALIVGLLSFLREINLAVRHFRRIVPRRAAL